MTAGQHHTDRPTVTAAQKATGRAAGIYGLIVEWGLDHWADPRQTLPGTINTNDGGRGVYFLDPSGHYLEIITRPYGSGR